MTSSKTWDVGVARKDNKLAIQHFTDTSIAVPMVCTCIAARCERECDWLTKWDTVRNKPDSAPKLILPPSRMCTCS